LLPPPARAPPPAKAPPPLGPAPPPQGPRHARDRRPARRDGTEHAPGPRPERPRDAPACLFLASNGIPPSLDGPDARMLEGRARQPHGRGAAAAVSGSRELEWERDCTWAT